MFNRTAKFGLKLLSGTDKYFECRYPTDQELVSRERNLVRVTRSNGAQDDFPRNFGPLERKFAASLMTEESAALLTDVDAEYLVDRLLRATVLDCERIGDKFHVQLRVPGGEVTHILGIPTLDAAQRYDKSRKRSTPKRNTVETVELLDGVEEFWKSVGGSAEGYAEGSEPPVNHKQAAIAEVLIQIYMAIEEVDPED